MSRKIFIDCDPGIDDFVAVLAALSMPELEVVGLASVAGNLPVGITTQNLGKILELAGKTSLPYAQGAEAPLARTPVTAEQVHGSSGLGSLTLPRPAIHPTAGNAAAFLYECAQKYKGELTVVAIGPLTNLARAFMAYPGLAGLLPEIVIMGGGHAFGNSTPKAEFNIFADPHAAHIVFESGVPLTMVGLDATMALGLTPEECRSFCPPTTAGRQVAAAFDDILSYSRRYGLGEVAYPHDLTAVICAAHPEVFDLLECRVDIELKGRLTFGQTVCDVDGVSKKTKNVKVAMGVAAAAYRQAVKNALAAV